ncbi:MAG: hypothetical protein K6G07_09305, partial [Lachnospiraceae bacterium]|nr:hypothetical protein [Lachnospiraceae bacterium]
YSIEDSGFLCGQSDYQRFMGKAEQKSYRDKAEQERSAERVKRVGSVGETYHSMVDGGVVNLTHEQVMERMREEQIQQRREERNKLRADKLTTVTSEELDIYGEEIRKYTFGMNNHLMEEGPNIAKDDEVLNLPYISDADFIANYGKIHEYHCRLEKFDSEICRLMERKELRKDAGIVRIRARLAAMEPLMQYLKARYDVMTHEKYDSFTNDEIEGLPNGIMEARMKKEKDPQVKEFYKKILKLRAIKLDVYDIKKKEAELKAQIESKIDKE